MTTRRLPQVAAFVLGYNIAVILFGAVVRATGSGAGCGAHWPTCGGDIVPLSGDAARYIEFAHRSSSGLALVAVLGLAFWLIRTRPPGDAARRSAIAAGFLVVNEALIGAALVLFEWVGDDQSLARGLSISIHLVNTFLLLAALTLTVRFLRGDTPPSRPFDPAPRRRVAWLSAALLTVATMGAITALGDTLFPAASLSEGLGADFTGVLLVRLRWVHPVLAVVTAWFLLRFSADAAQVTSTAVRLRWLVVSQVVIGVVNVALLAPVWMQVIHLLFADLVWIAFVATALATLRNPLKAAS